MRKNLLNLCLTALMCVVSTTAWALSEVNGVYQIGTAEDLEEFTALVNEGNRFANALLTADIVKSSPSTMIGTDAIEYEGIFDGAGHSITIDLKTESRGIALFRWVGRKGIVKDLKVQGVIATRLTCSCLNIAFKNSCVPLYSFGNIPPSFNVKL